MKLLFLAVCLVAGLALSQWVFTADTPQDIAVYAWGVERPPLDAVPLFDPAPVMAPAVEVDWGPAGLPYNVNATSDVRFFQRQPNQK